MQLTDEKIQEIIEDTYDRLCTAIINTEDQIKVTRDVNECIAEFDGKKVTRRIIHRLKEEFEYVVDYSSERGYQRFSVWYRGARHDFKLEMKSDGVTLDYDATQESFYLRPAMVRLQSLKEYRDDLTIVREFLIDARKFLIAKEAFREVQNNVPELRYVMADSLREITRLV